MTLRSSSLARARPLLGTIVEVRLGGADNEALIRASDAAFAAIERAHRLMSFHDTGSDVHALNSQTGNRPIRVDPWTWQVLEIALRMWRDTDGVFDCTVAPHLVAAGYLPRHPVCASGSAGGMEDIVLHEESRVSLRRAVQVDLGGIAKGYAVDRAVDAALNVAPLQGVVNAGGDMRLFGDAAESVYVRSPCRQQDLVFLGRFRNAAVATSATYYSRRRRGARWVSPLCDPANRELVAPMHSGTIVAKECVIADALTKPLMISANCALPCFALHGAMPHLLH